MAVYSVPFTNQLQEETSWCWAASAANCYNAIRPAGTRDVKQCQVVAGVLFGSPNPAPPNPCTDPDSYNHTHDLSDGLDFLRITDGLPRAPRFEDLSDELSGANKLEPKDPPKEAGMAEPVCAEVDFPPGDVPQFPQGAVHYVAISQVDTDSQHVWVEDPLLGPGHAMEFAFLDFIYNYGYSSAPAKTPGDAPEPVVAGFQKITKVNL